MRCLSAHVSRCHSVTAEFSPCSRFIATGSEDRSVRPHTLPLGWPVRGTPFSVSLYMQAYIYDLRTLSPLHKLSGHSDTVTSVTFHPLSPMVGTAIFALHTVAQNSQQFATRKLRLTKLALHDVPDLYNTLTLHSLSLSLSHCM